MTERKLFGKRLREIQEELISIRKHVQENNKEIVFYAIRIRYLLDFIQNTENRQLSFMALEAICEFYSNNITTEEFLSSLDKVIEKIKIELPKEEEIDSLEKKISKIQVTLPIEESKYLEEKFHQKAREIARIITED